MRNSSAEPVDGVLAGEGGPEQGEVVGSDGVEAGVLLSAVADGPAVPVEDAHRVGVVDCGGEGLQVAFVGGPADLVVAVKVRHSFSHRAPDAVPVLDPQDAEGGGVVDGGLDPKHVGLVVAFDRVAGHGVLDSPPFGAAPGGAGHLAGELRGELSPEEAQHVLGTEGGGGVREQAGQDGLEGAAGGEGDVRNDR